MSKKILRKIKKDFLKEIKESEKQKNEEIQSFKNN